MPGCEPAPDLYESLWTTVQMTGEKEVTVSTDKMKGWERGPWFSSEAFICVGDLKHVFVSRFIGTLQLLPEMPAELLGPGLPLHKQLSNIRLADLDRTEIFKFRFDGDIPMERTIHLRLLGHFSEISYASPGNWYGNER